MNSQVLVIRPLRFGCVIAAIFLILAAFILYIILARGLINSAGAAIITSLVVVGAALVGISELLSATVERIQVDGDTVQVRDRLGRHRRFARSELSHAAMRSTFPPSQPVVRMDDLLLVGNNGRCLLQVPESDYGIEAIERLVDALALARPTSEISTRRRARREFPGAFAFNYLAAGISVIVVLAVAVVLAAFKGGLR